MSDTAVKIIMLVLASALFPMVGYLLDIKAKRKKFKKKNNSEA